MTFACVSWVWWPRARRLQEPPYDGQAHWGLICELIDAGHAIAIARTRDGGAISVTVYVGEERLRSYAHSESELEELFEGLRSVAKAG